MEKERLYGFFRHLEGRVCGDIFEFGNEIDDPSLSSGALAFISDFLDVKRGVSCFDIYDLSLIPTGMLCGIFDLIPATKATPAKRNGKRTVPSMHPTFWPCPLWIDPLYQAILGNGACKVFDPSCGSGMYFWWKAIAECSKAQWAQTEKGIPENANPETSAKHEVQVSVKIRVWWLGQVWHEMMLPCSLRTGIPQSHGVTWPK